MNTTVHKDTWVCNSFFKFKPPTRQEMDRITKRLTFPSYTLEDSHKGSISVASTVGEVISGPSALILYINQPPKRIFLFFHSHFHFQAEQTVLSFLPFFPHSSISVIALFPGIERSCHGLSRSRWLKCPSGGHSNAQEFLNSLRSCSHLHAVTSVTFSSRELATSSCVF